MKRRWILFCVNSAVLVLVMAGCSSSSMIGDAEKALRTAIDSQSKGQIKLVSFKKKDGRKLEAMGTQAYELIYEAEIEFQSDGMWVTGATMSSGIGFNFDVRTGPRPKSISADLMKFAVSGKDVNRGDHVKLSGTMVGQKYESGWKFEIRSGEIASAPVSGEPARIADGSRATSETEDQRAAKKLLDQLQKKVWEVTILNPVLNDLRQINGAKQQWALENRKRGSDVPTEDDIKKYLGQERLPEHPPGGRYIINAVDLAPESTTFGTLDNPKVVKADERSGIEEQNHNPDGQVERNARGCLVNTGLLVSALWIYGKDHNGVMPNDLLSALSAHHESEKVSPAILMCPADVKRTSMSITNWAKMDASKISYKYLTSNAKSDDLLSKHTLLLLCPIHRIEWFSDDNPGVLKLLQLLP